MAMPSVAVVGGSIGGLTAALLLREAGCEVTVFERAPEPLDARGAGIAVLEETLRYPVQRLGWRPEQLSIRTHRVQFLDADGTVAHSEPHEYRFSSWNTIYRALHEAWPEDRYLMGWQLTDIIPRSGGTDLEFADGATRQADLLVCADGISSTGRSLLLPHVAPRYAGYVGWRGVVPESDLTPATRQLLGEAITYQVLPHSHILIYPIPGPEGALEPGRRLINMVWYRNVPETDLAEFLTDRHGVRRSVSLPPNSARPEVIAEMRDYARTHLAPPLAEAACAMPEPFVQAVLDIEVPQMVLERTCLLGDAAFAVRPHAAAGTAKAAEDAWVLAEELTRADGDVDHAISRWETRQLALGADLLARTRDIGDRSQFHGTFHPGDPRLVFGLYGPGR